ncbi:hypothetical protein [Paeniglutamicibacter kerguelensis]|uniref:Osmotically inducible lipoprotein OsmE n=1 Tax=Paeniglutamicibacter kerguelensis TaxID=254788 RepID=A0ABS4XIA1_9MICC|nr:hypothetical protein [Paeniglutamicibacter kerguelensis]MBP2388200.1 osmotically inducible lipoprotein OsmE [Paeniglutamicibacter kerguelensis]
MRRVRVMVPLSIAVLVACLSLVAWAFLDNVRALTLDVIMTDGDGDGIDVTTNPVEITNRACGVAVDCVEAYSTAEANYYRFSSRKRASDFAATLDDGFHVHYMVMDFAGKHDASKEHQLWAMEGLAGTWNDYEGTFPER